MKKTLCSNVTHLGGGIISLELNIDLYHTGVLFEFAHRYCLDISAYVYLTICDTTPAYIYQSQLL